MLSVIAVTLTNNSGGNSSRMPLQLEGLKISLALWGCLTVPTGKILSMDQAALVSSKGNRDS